MNAIYLDNYLCRNEYEFTHEFEKYFHFQESRNGALWRAANRFSPILTHPLRNVVWIHAWDDSPFSSDPGFEICLRNCNPAKNIFIQYETANPDFFKKLAEHRFGTLYPDIDIRNEHVLLINPDTNAGMDKLVEAVRKALICTYNC